MTAGDRRGPDGNVIIYAGVPRIDLTVSATSAPSRTIFLTAGMDRPRIRAASAVPTRRSAPTLLAHCDRHDRRSGTVNASLRCGTITGMPLPSLAVAKHGAVRAGAGATLRPDYWTGGLVCSPDRVLQGILLSETLTLRTPGSLLPGSGCVCRPTMRRLERR